MFMSSKILRAHFMQLCRRAPRCWSPWWPMLDGPSLVCKGMKEKGNWGEGLAYLMEIMLHDNEFMWWHLCASVSHMCIFNGFSGLWLSPPAWMKITPNCSVFYLDGFDSDIIRWWTMENLTELVQSKRGQDCFTVDIRCSDTWRKQHLFFATSFLWFFNCLKKLMLKWMLNP